MQHPNRDGKTHHLRGQDENCNLCLNGGITLLGGEIMTHKNREKLKMKYRNTGTKPRNVIIPETYN